MTEQNRVLRQEVIDAGTVSNETVTKLEELLTLARQGDINSFLFVVGKVKEGEDDIAFTIKSVIDFNSLPELVDVLNRYFDSAVQAAALQGMPHDSKNCN